MRVSLYNLSGPDLDMEGLVPNHQEGPMKEPTTEAIERLEQASKELAMERNQLRAHINRVENETRQAEARMVLCVDKLGRIERALKELRGATSVHTGGNR